MKKIVYILLLAMICGCSQFRFANDTWTSQGGAIFKHDKIEHAVFSGLLYGILRIAGIDRLKAFTLTVSAGIAWEVKDGILPYEIHGSFGGDGFSNKDIVCDTVGVFIVLLIETAIWRF